TNVASAISFKKGTDNVPFTAAVSSDGKTIMVTPDAELAPSTAYVCSIIDNALKFTLDGSSVAGVSSAFTTGTTPAMVVYTDFDGTSSVTMLEALGDPVGATDTITGSNGNSTNVLSWVKGSSWWGYERIKLKLANPIDLSQDKVFSFDIYSENDTRVRFMLSPDGTEKDDDNHKREANVIGGQWQTLYFEFSSADLAGESINYLLVYGDLGGSGATFLFDNISGPELLTLPIVTSPANASEGLSIYTSSLSITSEVAMRKINDSEIIDPSELVFMKKGSEAFMDYTAKISSDKKTINFELNTTLEVASSYTFGILNDLIELNDDKQSVVNDLVSTFTTETDAPVDSVMLANYEEIDLLEFASWNSSATFAKVMNPDKSGINVSDSVGEFTWLKSGETNIGVPLDESINFLATPYVRMKVWAENPIDVTVKFENQAEYWVNREVSTQVEDGQTGQWTELLFDFSNTVPTNLNKILIYIDGTGDYSAANMKYYFDDIQVSRTAPQLKTKYSPETGETGITTLASYSIISNLAFGLMDADSELTGDTLASFYTLRKTDANGAIIASVCTVNGGKNSLSITPLSPLDAHTQYWFGIEDNTLRYPALKQNISGLSSTFTTGDAAAMVVYEDFDGNTMTEVVDAMGDPAGAINTLAADPDPSSGLNFCAQWDKETSWSGWERIHIELTDPVNFNKDQIFSLRVYSPKITNVRFKLGTEKGNEGGKAIEKDAYITDTAQWQTLHFGFMANEIPDTTFKHIFIYIAGGVAESATFFIDDLKGPALDDGTAIPSVKGENSLAVYPNPATDRLYISDAKDGDVLELFNSSGQLLKHTLIVGQSVSISDMHTGMYIIRVNDKFTKFIKE
ncbi:MAG: T9SS type A sorting domain-containing protein, partial [Bacteroidales bacterium]|nr:T9SS type A sorting domain-containing protein [Bacteroidales bacterium]